MFSLVALLGSEIMKGWQSVAEEKAPCQSWGWFNKETKLKSDWVNNARC